MLFSAGNAQGAANNCQLIEVLTRDQAARMPQMPPAVIGWAKGSRPPAKGSGIRLEINYDKNGVKDTQWITGNVREYAFGPDGAVRSITVRGHVQVRTRDGRLFTLEGDADRVITFNDIRKTEVLQFGTSRERGTIATALDRLAPKPGSAGKQGAVADFHVSTSGSREPLVIRGRIHLVARDGSGLIKTVWIKKEGKGGGTVKLDVARLNRVEGYTLADAGSWAEPSRAGVSGGIEPLKKDQDVPPPRRIARGSNVGQNPTQKTRIARGTDAKEPLQSKGEKQKPAEPEDPPTQVFVREPATGVLVRKPPPARKETKPLRGPTRPLPEPHESTGTSTTEDLSADDVEILEIEMEADEPPLNARPAKQPPPIPAAARRRSPPIPEAARRQAPHEQNPHQLLLNALAEKIDDEKMNIEEAGGNSYYIDEANRQIAILSERKDLLFKIAPARKAPPYTARELFDLLHREQVKQEAEGNRAHQRDNLAAEKKAENTIKHIEELKAIIEANETTEQVMDVKKRPLARSSIDGDRDEALFFKDGLLTRGTLERPADYVEKFQKPIEKYLQKAVSSKEPWRQRIRPVFEPNEVLSTLQQYVAEKTGLETTDPRIQGISIEHPKAGGMHIVYAVHMPETLKNIKGCPQWDIVRTTSPEIQKGPGLGFPVLLREIGISHMAAEPSWNLPVLNITTDAALAQHGWTVTERVEGHSATEALAAHSEVFQPTDRQRENLDWMIGKIKQKADAFQKYSTRYFHSRVSTLMSKEMNGLYQDVQGWDVVLPKDVVLQEITPQQAYWAEKNRDPWVVKLDTVEQSANGRKKVVGKWYHLRIRDF